MSDASPSEREGLVPMRLLVAGTVLFTCCLVAAPRVQAQEAGVIEEVMVTAQRRVQSLDEVPVAVSVIDADTLSQNRAGNVLDVAALDPSFNATFGNISVRGITTFVIGNALQPSTAVYIDGVYLNDSESILGDLLDVERVEILRGPQGTLFGRNAAAGAVSVTTAAPGDEFEGEFRVGAGDHDLREASIVLNTPFSETVSARTSAFVRDRGGPIKNLSGGADFLEEDRWGVRTRLRWLASDTLTVELGGDYTEYEGGKGVGPGYGAGVPGFITRTSDVTGFVDTRYLADENDEAFVQSMILLRDGVPFAIDPNEGSRDVGGASALVEWAISDALTLTSTTSFRFLDQELPVLHDFANLDINYLTNLYQIYLFFPPFQPFPPAFASSFVAHWDNENEEFSQELRLNGQSSAVDWFVGVNYFSVEYDNTQRIAYPQGVAFLDPSFTGDYSDLRTDGITEIESVAVFGDAIIALGDATNLSVGLRYSRDKTKIIREQLPVTATKTSYLDTSAGDVAFDDDWDNLSGRVVLDYSFNEDVMVYAGVTTGYKAGGFNSDVPYGAVTAEMFDEETSVNYEIGLKATFLDGAARLNAALFHTDYEDYQFQTINPENPFGVLNLTADATIRGLELGSQFALSESLFVGLSASYLDEAEFNSGSVDGQALLGAPEFAAVATADWFANLGETGTLRFNLTYSYSDSWRLENIDLARTEQTVVALQTLVLLGPPTGHALRESDLRSGSYGILNATVTFTPPSERWDLRLWGTNLTDEAYRSLGNTFSAAFGGSAAPAYSRNEPLAWGVDFTYRLGGG